MFACLFKPIFFYSHVDFDIVIKCDLAYVFRLGFHHIAYPLQFSYLSSSVHGTGKHHAAMIHDIGVSSNVISTYVEQCSWG